MNYNNQIAAPDEKLVFAEPEMEVVLFDENDISTSPFNSGNGIYGEDDDFGSNQGGFAGEQDNIPSV